MVEVHSSLAACERRAARCKPRCGCGLFGQRDRWRIVPIPHRYSAELAMLLRVRCGFPPVAYHRLQTTRRCWKCRRSSLVLFSPPRLPSARCIRLQRRPGNEDGIGAQDVAPQQTGDLLTTFWPSHQQYLWHVFFPFSTRKCKTTRTKHENYPVFSDLQPEENTVGVKGATLH
jgi:hypothetical protein